MSAERERPAAADSSLRQLRGWRSPSNGIRLEDCCLIVATYERPGDVVRLLDGLSRQPDVPAEVAVVDGSKDRRTEQAIRTWRSSARASFDLLFVESPTGLTLQRNVGIDATDRELVFFLDDDCVTEPGYFQAIRDVFRADSSREVGGVGGAIVNEIGGTMSRRWKLRLALGLYPRGEPGRYYPTATSVPISLARPFSGTRPVDILAGCTMAFRREVFHRERFSTFFDGYSQGEDLEMSLRVGRTWRLLWCGDARVLHEHAEGGRPRSFEKGRMEIRNRYFIWKRRTPHAPLKERFHFWADVAYMLAYDAASFVFRGGRRADLKHAAGMLRGAGECLLSPPRHVEPPACRQFVVRWEEFRPFR